MQLQANQSSWSRADEPIYIGDLSDAEALEFLTATDCGIKHERIHKGHVNENQEGTPCIDRLTASKVVGMIGGRIQNLLQVRRDMHEGLRMEDAIARQKGKEKEKILIVASSSTSIEGLKKLLDVKGRKMALTEFVSVFSKEDLQVLLKQNILCIKREGSNMTVKFYSKLTESVLEEWIDAKKNAS